MKKQKQKQKLYPEHRDYYLVQGIVTSIEVQNQEFEKGEEVKFKNVFSIETVPAKNSDIRFQTCISWNRQTFKIGSLVSMKGYFLKNAFLVESMAILAR